MRDALIRGGMPAERVIVTGVGETTSTAPEQDTDGMALERRVEMNVVDLDARPRRGARHELTPQRSPRVAGSRRTRSEAAAPGRYFEMDLDERQQRHRRGARQHANRHRRDETRERRGRLGGRHGLLFGLADDDARDRHAARSQRRGRGQAVAQRSK